MTDDDVQPLVGIVPAAGKATRLGAISCSKEVLPLTEDRPSVGSSFDVPCECLLQGMREAGAQRAHVILRRGKWDIPDYLGDGRDVGLPLSYLVMDRSPGVPYTVDHAYPFVDDGLVLFGFPDILFRPSSSFARLVEKQSGTEADIVLGLYPAPRPAKADMVEYARSDRVRAIVIKPQQTALTHAWIMAVWTPVFSRFLHEYLDDPDRRDRSDTDVELFIGDVFQEAVDEGLDVRAVTFSDFGYIDVGTPEELAQVRQGRW